MPVTPPDAPGGSQNAILAGLPERDLRSLLGRMERCALERRQVLTETNEPIRHVYFPLSGVISLVNATVNGATVEVAMVGREGLIGLPILFGAETMPLTAIVQVPGEGLRINAASFRDTLRRHPSVLEGTHLFAHALLVQVAQSAACLRHHSVSQRCARWLLMTHDRVGGDAFVLTQDLLAQMLGVRRASVSAAAGKLQQEGLIRYRRGNITVVDRPALERASCECYGIIKVEYERPLRQTPP
jgi:CRP-like cAMP-binding protein